MIEPSAIAVITGILVPVVGALLYVIRSEIKKNTVTTDATHAQTIPNHGTSLRDAVDRIERGRHEDRRMFLSRIDEVHSDVKATRTDLAKHITWHLDKE